ncbi:MAG: 50S ribosomal protein L18e [Candidatus Woesearchaeota archaeon]
MIRKNDVLKTLIIRLERVQAPIWKRVASDLNKPTRQRRNVNISKLAMYAKSGEKMLVPGKVLASGVLSEPVHVVAYQYSSAAEQKIVNAGGSITTIESEIKANPKGSKLRIIG